MKWNNFLFSLLAVIVLTFIKAQYLAHWWPIDLATILIFFIIRSGNMTWALIQVFILSLAMDFIFQTAHINGASAMGQLLMVYGIIHLKRYIAPTFEDFFLFIFLMLFYIGNHYLSLGLSRMFGAPHVAFSAGNLFLYASLHAVLFVFILLIVKRLQRGDP